MNKPIRLRQFFRSLGIFIRDSIILQGLKNKIQPKTLLIVKLDAIGDYLLFRNFLEDIRRSKKFSGYRITLCGNMIWKELAEDLDKFNVDEFFWIDKRKFITERDYRNNILKEINSKGFEVAFQPTFSRELITGDLVILATQASQRIGSRGDDANENFHLKKLGDAVYTRLLNKNSKVDFEFEKNKMIVGEFTGEEILRVKPQLANVPKMKPEHPYAVLFPGAGEEQKRWDPGGFAEVADQLKTNYNLEIKIFGAHSDSKIADEIIEKCIAARPVNLCGKTNLHELIREISNAGFLLSNDSVALHIAACFDVRTVCILNGRHFGRFAPYPSIISPYLHFVFPEKMDELISENNSEAVLRTKYRAVDSIQSITTKKVLKMIEKALK
ncbi:MAG: glycosyltransferase family 9 protein [Bacteroidia bacterium]